MMLAGLLLAILILEKGMSDGVFPVDRDFVFSAERGQKFARQVARVLFLHVEIAANV